MPDEAKITDGLMDALERSELKQEAQTFAHSWRQGNRPDPIAMILEKAESLVGKQSN